MGNANKKSGPVPAGTRDELRDYHMRCVGKVAISIDVKIDTREMSVWSEERIECLFQGIALVERAMAGLADSVDDTPENDLG